MTWLPHLLALLVAGPALADRWLFSPRGASRMGLYLRIVTWQAGTSALILSSSRPSAIWRAPGTAPGPWLGWTAVLAAMLFLAWIVVPLLRTGGEGRKKAAGFWPKTRRERAGWAVVAVISGIGEEIMFRGYLLHYFHVFPWQWDMVAAIGASCLLFGLGHLYQGAVSGARAAAAGLFFFGLFLGSGSLLLPIAAHVAGDLAGLLPSAWRRQR